MVTSSAASMKLFVDVGAGRVVFAEAGKDVVDFLFSLLALPLGRADTHLAPLGGTGGSVGNLYASVEGLDPAHVHPGAASRETLLQPTVLSPPAASAHLSFHQQRELYTCSNAIFSFVCNSKNVADDTGTICPSCGEPMTEPARYVPPGSADGDVGFVRAGDTARYIITDDLRVLPGPTSAFSGIALLRDLGVNNVGALLELEVQLGSNEEREILKASLLSKTVLTDVFLRRRAHPEASTASFPN